MPLSLWLVPRPSNPFTTTASELINDTVPSNYRIPLDGKSTPKFTPHVTLLSQVPTPTNDDVTSWLANLPLPTDFKKEHNELLLPLDEVQCSSSYFRKLFITVEKTPNLVHLVSTLRSHILSEPLDAAKQWAESEEFTPHMSLMYADLDTADVKKRVGMVEMQIQYAIGDLFACCGGTLCMGGFLVVVDTGDGEGGDDAKKVEGWKVLGEREVGWVNWRATRNLI